MRPATSTSEVAATGVTRHRLVRRQPPPARWRLDLLDELRGTPWELKPGFRRSAPGLSHTSFAFLPRLRVQQRRLVDVKRWSRLCYHSLLRAQQAKTQIQGSQKAKTQTTPIRKLHATGAVAQKYEHTWGCERCHWGNAVNKSHDAGCRQRMTSLLCQWSRVQEKPEARVTPWTRPRTCEFVVGCGRHGDATGSH